METTRVLLERVIGATFMDEEKVVCRAHCAGIACVKVPRATDIWCFGGTPLWLVHSEGDAQD